MTLRLPGSLAAIVASSVVLAAATPAQAVLSPIRGVSYGPASTEIATIYQPSGATALSSRLAAGDGAGMPAVVLVHGGGWRQQANETEQPTVAQGLRAHGSVVFDIDYPQANAQETAFPKEPEAVDAAIEWVREHAAEYGANPQNIVLVGGSAGGHLVDLAGEQVPGVRAVVSLSGPTNLEALVQMGQRRELQPSLTISLAIAFGCGAEAVGVAKILGCTDTELQREFSPVFNVPGSPCPNWLLYTAEFDLVPASQQWELLAGLRSAGCKASLGVVPGVGHAFGYWPSVNSAVYSFIAAN